MSDRPHSSRALYRRYVEDLVRRRKSGQHINTDEKGQPRKRGRTRSSRDLLRAFWNLLGTERRPVAWALGALTVATVLTLVPPAATKFIVDYVLTDQPYPAWLTARGFTADNRFTLLTAVVGTVIAVSLLRILLGVSGRWLGTRSTKRLQLSVRKQAFEHAVRLPLRRVHELRSGGVASLLREDAGSVGELVFGLLYNPWRAIIQLLGSLCVLAWVDWRLLLGATLLIPGVFFSHRTWLNRIRPRYKDIRARRMEIDGHATEAFGGMRVVRAFSRQRTESRRFMTANDVMARQELAVWWWARGIETVWELLLPLASAALMLYGGWAVLHGLLTVGDLMMFLAYVLMLLGPLAVLAESATSLQNSLSALDRVLDLLGEPREFAADGPNTQVSKAQIRGDVALENVTFRYSEESPFSLHEIDLDVEAGQTVALVGPSGAGKTTLCNLVARFYDPVGGRVLLDGNDIREIDVENYRTLLGIVEQDVFLFDGTIAENIGYANREAGDAAIRRAARIANADEFIRALPEGYESIIGERGVKLSGGQRQRLAIARAVLADPKILILDEATSNLDSESERLIQQSLRTLMRDRTCFVIAHRLSTIRDADLILVVEGGRIVERGTHEELLANGGRYRDMVQAQLLANETLAPAMEPELT
ncbi:MAG: ABC transporter ATP-binding protein [Planctomycetaceae bacterium]|nr:ABC transporter ATP-binding protein [Planctomycetaceae bacterium]